MHGYTSRLNLLGLKYIIFICIYLKTSNFFNCCHFPLYFQSHTLHKMNWKNRILGRRQSRKDLESV